jgi:hypothetical protein
MRPTAARTLAVTLSAALLLGPGAAHARSEKTVTWDLATVYPTAVRFLRIDAGVTIVEKDAEAGYVLFELKEEGRTFRGSLELVATKKDGRDLVRLVLNIEDRPEYVEVGMLDRLERKLRGEHGPPPRRDPAPTRPTKPTKPADEPPAAPAKP